MWLIPESVKIFVSTSPTDLRKSWNGLSNLAESVIRQDPLSGHVFVFFNRSRDRVKILWWHRGGFNLFCRRLEKGRFATQAIFSKDQDCRTVSGVELTMILEGIDLTTTRKRARWIPKRSRLL